MGKQGLVDMLGITDEQFEKIEKKNRKSVRLPNRLNHKTPMPLIADAYTVGSDLFASEKAKEKSVYYITFRRILEKINPDLYNKGDNRIIFYGLSRIIDYLFYYATNHEELETAQEFLKNGKVTADGLKPFPFPRHLWDRVVKEFNGRPPIKISAMPEGSVVYPNEPVAMVESMADGMGEMAAWFESSLLKIWASSEYVTQLAHWLEYCKTVVRVVYGDEKTEDEVHFIASCMLHNFGCRAGICPQESEWLGADSLLIFPSTDTFSGAYQQWVNADKAPGTYVSIQALAHRNIQGYKKETDCFRALKDSSEPGDYNSNVADCYDFWTAVEGKKGKEGTGDCLLAMALESKESGDNIVTIARPDSGNPEEQVIWLCKLAHSWGLSITENHNNKEWRFGTLLKVLEGDGMSWGEMKHINEKMLEHAFAPFTWGVPYGVGGGLRNEIRRDNLSAKYAMCAVGNKLRPVCKFSETLEKTTLPGPFKVLRSKEALDSKETIVFPDEPGDNVMRVYFDGSDIWDPFKEGYGDSPQIVAARIKEQMRTMPLTLSTEDNHNYPASKSIKAERIKLLKKYASKKMAQNYS